VGSRGLTFAVLIVGLANVAPVVLLPIFYTVKPLDRETLRGRLMSLAEHAGAQVVGAYEWGLAEKTRKANAALAGLGSTRRILISDTMLSEYSEDEIEVVLAHELGHHVHGDIWKGLFFEGGLIVAGFYLAFLVLGAAAPALHLAGPADPAGMPLLIIAGGIVTVVMIPAANALSRRYERSADRFALELTRNPAAFHLRHAPAWRAKPRGGKPVARRPMAVLQPPADRRSHRVCARVQNLIHAPAASRPPRAQSPRRREPGGCPVRAARGDGPRDAAPR
jgi:Zn-dependent protease with chaperone function